MEDIGPGSNLLQASRRDDDTLCKTFVTFRFYELTVVTEVQASLMTPGGQLCKKHNATVTSGRVSCVYTPAHINIWLLFVTSLILLANSFRFLFILLV